MHMHVSAAFQHFDILGLLFGLSIGVALIIAFAGGGGAAALSIAALPPSLPECHASCIIIILSLYAWPGAMVLSSMPQIL